MTSDDLWRTISWKADVIICKLLPNSWQFTICSTDIFRQNNVRIEAFVSRNRHLRDWSVLFQQIFAWQGSRPVSLLCYALVSAESKKSISHMREYMYMICYSVKMHYCTVCGHGVQCTRINKILLTSSKPKNLCVKLSWLSSPQRVETTVDSLFMNMSVKHKIDWLDRCAIQCSYMYG